MEARIGTAKLRLFGTLHLRLPLVTAFAALAVASSQALVPNDPYFANLWWMRNDGTFSYGEATPRVDADIDMTEAWEITRGDSSIVLAFLDTGCKLSHREFAGRLWHNPGEIPDNNRDDDGNGYVDDVHGWDFVNSDNVPEDNLGHGTRVAGVAAANGNDGFGYVGVDWRCKLMVLKITDAATSGTTIATVAEAIRYAADNGARVVNISIGDDTGSPLLKSAIDYARAAGVVVVAAAGNQNSSAVRYPARYEGVIAVGGTDPDDERSVSFMSNSSIGSNYGQNLDVVAPGNYMYLLDHEHDTVYTTIAGGTSVAAPVVSGIATLLLAQDPTRDPADIDSILKHTADDRVGRPEEDVGGFDIYHGYGRVNAYAALSLGVSTAIAGEPARSCRPSTRSATVRLRGGLYTVERRGPNGPRHYSLDGSLLRKPPGHRSFSLHHRAPIPSRSHDPSMGE